MTFVNQTHYFNKYTLEGRKSWRDETGKIKGGTYHSVWDMSCQIVPTSKMRSRQWRFCLKNSPPKISATSTCWQTQSINVSEYVWGLIKRHYRSIPFENKKGKDKFEKAIWECISNVTKEHVNICSLQRADFTRLPTSIRQKREKVGKLNLPVRGSKGSWSGSSAIGILLIKILDLLFESGERVFIEMRLNWHDK